MLKSTSSSIASPEALVFQAALAERKRRIAQGSSRFLPYRDKPEKFVSEILLGFLWSKQREIARSVVKNRRTAVASCHDVGKTYIAAAIGAHWLSEYPAGEAFLVTLAPTGHQVKGQLWREINRMHKSGGLPGHTNLTEWYIGNELIGYGRSPKDTDPTAIQGQHARRMLVILDEACGIAKSLWDAVDTLIANEDCRILAIGNPDDPATEFGAVCRPGSGWNFISISAFDSPNFTREKVPDWLRPLLVSKVWVEEKKKKWRVSSPLYISKVLGRFPEQSSDALIPYRDLRAALEPDRLAKIEAEGKEPNQLGYDIARYGDDYTVGYHRLGGVYRRIRRENNRSLMTVVGYIVEDQKKTGATVVKVDDAGLGGGVTDRLQELADDGDFPAQVIGVNVGEGANRKGDGEDEEEGEEADERFANLRARINWQAREKFMSGDIALAGEEGEHDDLLTQASQIKYLPHSKGKILIEPKAKMKKRLKGLSPDDWDSFVLAQADIEVDDLSVWAKL